MDKPSIGRAPRPVPSDFAAVAVGKSRDELCDIYKAGKQTIARWRDEVAGKGKLRIRQPVQLPDNISELAQGKSIAGLAKVLNMHSATLWSVMKKQRPDLFEMCRANGNLAKVRHAVVAAGHATLERPGDFDDVVSGMSIAQAAKHWGCGVKTIHKWLRTSPEWVREGMAKARIERSRAGAINSGRASLRRQRQGGGGNASVLRYLGDTVHEAPILPRDRQAMRYLQKFGPCYPMSVHNKALDGYSFRGIRMTAAQIIAEAEKRGWNPDAWREIVQERAA